MSSASLPFGWHRGKPLLAFWCFQLFLLAAESMAREDKAGEATSFVGPAFEEGAGL